MSKTFSLLSILAVILLGYFLLNSTKDSYKLLPVNDQEANYLMTESNTSNGQETWHEFTAPSGKFKVLLPLLPQHAKDKILDPKTKQLRKYDMYVASKGQSTAFMIGVITFPSKIDPSTLEDTLATIVDDMLTRNRENKLKMKKMENFQGRDTLNFAIENNDMVVTGKAFVVDDTIYILTMLNKNNSFKQSDFDFFVNSFNINQKPE